MDGSPDLDFLSSIRYALTPRSAPDGSVDIVLHLFRGVAPALTRTVVSVAPEDVAPVLARCGHHLEARGAHAVMPVAQVGPGSILEPTWTAPMAAFDWIFAG